MNIDPTKKALEQEEQNQQQQSAETTTTNATVVLALLLSPSSPSSTSTVSPTASSISKNSSTDEVDETTAEVETQPEKCIEEAERREHEVPQLKVHPLELEQRVQVEDDGHQYRTTARQHEHYQRSSAEQQPGIDTPSITLAASATGLLEGTTNTTLLAQCIPEHVTTEVGPEGPEFTTVASDSTVKEVEESGTTTDVSVPPTQSSAEPPRAPQSLSPSSSSSTASTPSVGEERRLPVVLEEDVHPEDGPADDRCCAPSAVTNNNSPPADGLADRTDRCINDCYNNNSKRSDSDSDSQIEVAGTQEAKVTDRNDDNEAAKAVSASILVVEEGVLTSAAALMPEIAPTQGGSASVIGNNAAADRVTSEGEAVAPTEIVQTRPPETTDHTTTADQPPQNDIITTAAVGGAPVAVKSDDDEGAPASDGTVVGSSPPSCSPVTMSSSESTSSDSSPEALAGLQQERTSTPEDDTQRVVDNRSLCDISPPKGHSLDDEGPADATQVQPSSTSRQQPGGNDDEYRGSEGQAPVTSSTRLLTLAEELSQAAAASSYASPATGNVAPPSSAVVDVLPKSAAVTAAAVVSGSSRSISPVLHSSLKKPNRMGVLTGAATALATVATGENRRRVSFPKDAQLITGYLDPVNPWAGISICDTSELLELYRSSCKRHNTLPLNAVLEHLKSIDVMKGRVPLLSLKDQHLTYSGCEALEEIFKHVQYRCIDLSHSGLDDVTASVMFDIIEYYEAANELDISDNLQMSGKTWTACINMIKKSQALNVLITRGPAISDYQASTLAKALSTSAIHTLKLEYCVLSQQPIASLCSYLKRNTVLRELWLAHNQLICEDALHIANLLRTNFYIQLIDISNNRIGDKGVEHIVGAIVEQSVYFKDVQEKKRKGDLNFSDLSSSLNNINSMKNHFPHRLRSTDSMTVSATDTDLDASHSALTLTPPVTPPSTPALPSGETPTEDVGHVSETMHTPNGAIFAEKEATVYTMKQPDGDENNPPLPPTSPASPATPPTPGVAAPPNVNLVEMSTKHSVSLQTTSDRERADMVVRPMMVTTSEEEALILKSSGGGASASGRRTEGDEVGKVSTTGDTVQTDQRISPVTGGESLDALLQSLESQSDSPVPQAPKKARLAKQDSVLSEFEATAMDTGEGESVERRVHRAPSGGHNSEEAAVTTMEEDVPELCADYDDDGSNLRISEENLFVDLGIPALCDEEPTDSKATPTDASSEVFPPLTPPAKKDELQLRIEKSQPKDIQQDAAIGALGQSTSLVPHGGISMMTPPEGLGGSEIESAISSDVRPEPSSAKKDRTQSSSSDSIAMGKGVHMVEVEIKSNVPLSRSLDSVGGDESDFETSSPFRTTAPTNFPNERSFSSESLNSETSMDSNDSKSSLKIHESKFAAKNGTLERQQSSVNRETLATEQAAATPTGLQVLVLWNNEITRNSVRHFARLLEKTSTLDTLNVGSNQLCNSFVAGISGSLKANTSLTNLGLQGAHLSDKGAKAMAEIVEFGGNSSLQRIDLRNNNIQKAGLDALNEAMKSNKSITRVDLDDSPRRVKDTTLDGVGSEYSRLVNNIRAQCERNKNPPEPSEPVSTAVRRARANYLSSRKISLTCQSIKTSPSALADKQHLLDPNGGCKKSTGGRLRSPLPSPIPSPIASPVPSPSRNRFHVSRVTDSGGAAGSGSVSSPSSSSTGSSPTLFLPSNSRFRVVTVAEPDLAGGQRATNPHRSSSTISLPMSKPSVMSVGVGAGTATSATSAINRRPVCSSAPTLSSFPSSPLSPLAAHGVPVVNRSGAVSQMPVSGLLPPPHGGNAGHTNTFNTVILPAPLITATGTIVMPTQVPAGHVPMPLSIPQTQPPQQAPLTPQFVPVLHQQPSNYHFVTAYGPVNAAAPVPLQPMVPQVFRYPSLAEQTPPTQVLQQTVPPPAHSPSFATKGRAQCSEPGHSHQHSSSSNSSTLHDSVLSSTSIESPDLEVKRFMSGGTLLDDSCCSSISSASIDSMDNPNFNINTSISSTDESFDLVISSPPPVTVAGGTVLMPPGGTTTGSNDGSVMSVSRPLEEENTLIPRAAGSNVGKVPPDAPAASVSSSSMVHVHVASSQESLYDLNDLSGSSNSSSMSAAMNPNPNQALITALPAAPLGDTGAKMAGIVAGVALSASNSNESTLTSVQNIEKEPSVKVATEKAPRVRKTSWILGGSGGGGNVGGRHTDSSSSGGSTPTPSGSSGYPPAIEKLLSIFHPSNLFSSSKTAASASPPPNAGQEASAGGSQPPSRKESPMGGLFYWAHHGTGSSGGNSANTSPTSANAKKDEERAGLKVNVSPETTLTPQQLQPLQNQAQMQTHSPAVVPSPAQQHSADRMPAQLKVEMKENISPENTITNKLLLSSTVPPVTGGMLSDADTSIVAAAVAANPVPVVPATVGGFPHAKVIFKLGGDYDESEDDIDTLTSKFGNHPNVASVATTSVGPGGIHCHGGNLLSGSSSLLGSTTSNSSGISIGSGTSTGEMSAGSGLVASPTPSAISGQSSTSDTVVVLSHLGQLARDSLSMFKNPSLTSQDSISIRSMDSLPEMAPDAAKHPATRNVPPSAPITVPHSENAADRTVRSALLVSNVPSSTSASPQKSPTLPVAASPDKPETL